MAAELGLLWLARAVFGRALPMFVTPLPAWSTAALLIAGIGVRTLVLLVLGLDGFAPGGLPTVEALLYVAAVMMPASPNAASEPTSRCRQSPQAPPGSEVADAVDGMDRDGGEEIAAICNAREERVAAMS